jgi:hypothetical protein
MDIRSSNKLLIDCPPSLSFALARLSPLTAWITHPVFCSNRLLHDAQEPDESSTPSR